MRRIGETNAGSGRQPRGGGGRYGYPQAPLRLALLAVALLTIGACASSPTRLTPSVVDSYPHDASAFTQGLLLADGLLYESTGLYGESSLREVDLRSGEVVRVRPLPSQLFGEGLALVDDRLVQLTWRAGEALVYDRETFELLQTHRYEGEGWGLCFDGEELWMSDGSSTLFVRDPDDFALLREIEVRLEGEPVERLNELECVENEIYANVWLTDEIVTIDKGSGRVKSVIDASGLLSADVRAELSPDAVLNGIAYDSESGRFLLTGKLWPTLFEVEFR